MSAPRREHELGAPPRAPAAAVALGVHALGEQDRLADERHAGAADEHEVGRAPERHVLPEHAVPEVVEREAEQGEPARGRHEHAADRRVPIGADPHGGAPRPLADGEGHREHAGGEDAEEADEDQVVRRVGERAVVAAVVGVDRDVPHHPHERREQRGAGDGGGEGHPARQLRDAPGEGRGPRQQRARAAAVGDRQPHEDRARAAGDRGRDDDLVGRGGARGLRLDRGEGGRRGDDGVGEGGGEGCGELSKSDAHVAASPVDDGRQCYTD